jgi:homoserine kinase type II
MKRELLELLARYPPHAQPLSELESLGGAGGYSGSRFWRYQSLSGPLVLRAWPDNGPGRSHLERIHHWLSLASETGLCPVPLRDNSDRSLQEFQGTFWEITPWLPGEADSARPLATGRLESAFSGLSALHRRWAGESSRNVSPGLASRLQIVEHLLHGGFDSIEAAVATQAGSADGITAAAGSWLALARTVAPALRGSLSRAARSVVALQPCLRDARREHFLFERDRLTGIVDFGAMGVDCVSSDLARLIGDWLEGDPTLRARALAAYERIRPLEPAEATLIRVFETSADLLMGQRWLQWHFLEGRHFDDPRSVMEGLARGLKRLERLAQNHDGAIPR